MPSLAYPPIWRDGSAEPSPAGARRNRVVDGSNAAHLMTVQPRGAGRGRHLDDDLQPAMLGAPPVSEDQRTPPSPARRRSSSDMFHPPCTAVTARGASVVPRVAPRVGPVPGGAATLAVHVHPRLFTLPDRRFWATCRDDSGHGDPRRRKLPPSPVDGPEHGYCLRYDARCPVAGRGWCRRNGAGQNVPGKTRRRRVRPPETGAGRNCAGTSHDRTDAGEPIRPMSVKDPPHLLPSAIMGGSDLVAVVTGVPAGCRWAVVTGLDDEPVQSGRPDDRAPFSGEPAVRSSSDLRERTSLSQLR